MMKPEILGMGLRMPLGMLFQMAYLTPTTSVPSITNYIACPVSLYHKPSNFISHAISSSQQEDNTTSPSQMSS